MTTLTLFLISAVVLVVGVLAVGLLKAMSDAQADLMDMDGDGHDREHELRGRLIASQQRFRRQTEWQRPAVTGIKRGGDVA